MTGQAKQAMIFTALSSHPQPSLPSSNRASSCSLLPAGLGDAGHKTVLSSLEDDGDNCLDTEHTPV